MPRHTKLCHGDFNPSNVVVGEDGKLYVLDWAHATQGNASADAARTYLLFRPSGNDELAQRYLQLFCEKSGTALTYVRKWMPIVAASQSVKGNETERALLHQWGQRGRLRVNPEKHGRKGNHHHESHSLYRIVVSHQRLRQVVERLQHRLRRKKLGDRVELGGTSAWENARKASALRWTTASSRCPRTRWTASLRTRSKAKAVRSSTSRNSTEKGVTGMVYIEVCVGSSCHPKGAPEIVELMQQHIADEQLEDDIILDRCVLRRSL